MVIAVNDIDKNGFMTTINGLDTSIGLDLILHTPGGDIAATESIVDYLWQTFSGNIRCFVPQMAMSAGTMIACSSKEIWMGKHSSLGPIDPLFDNVPAHGVIEEFQRAYNEILDDPRTIPIWQPVISKYEPAFLGECEKAVKWANELVSTWLSRNMFAEAKDKESKIYKIVNELADHSKSYAHNRHLSNKKCREIGLVVRDLEDDQELQDKVLSVHHIYYHTLSDTNALKIIENQNGMAFIQQVRQFMPPSNRVAQQNQEPPKALRSEQSKRDRRAGKSKR